MSAGRAIAAVTVALLAAACGENAKHTTTAATAPPTGPATTATVLPSPRPTSGTTPPPQAHAEIPALYTVTPNGSVEPPMVSVPAAIPIELTVVSRDGRAHTALLERHALRVPAGGRSSVLISGLKSTTYALVLDGKDRGALVIGAQPGP